jgi:aspartate racemase
VLVAHIESQPAEIQKQIPGLIGMATPTNGAYLRAMQSQTPKAGSEHRDPNHLKTILYELDFAELVRNVRASSWLKAEAQIAEAAAALKAAGAEFLVITSNTGITLSQRASAETSLPILDIVQPTLAAVRNAHGRSAGLLSTRRTLESGVYQDAAKPLGLGIVPPAPNIISRVEEIIFAELVFGEATARALDSVTEACEWFVRQGADSVILGCTDMTHLAEQLRRRTSLFVADTTVIHAAAAAEVAWNGSMRWPV